MRRLFWLSLLGLISLAGQPAAFAQPGPTKPAPVAKAGPKGKGPRLLVAKKEHDFGEVIHGTLVKVSVPLRNVGDAPLVLKQVKPSCGCTVATYPKTLAPGAKGVMQLLFDSRKRPEGYQSFRVAVYTNDPTQSDLGSYCTLINLRGEVRTLFRKAPYGAYFGEFVHGLKARVKTIVVTGQGRGGLEGFDLKLASKLPPHLRVKIAKLGPKARRPGFRVEVTLLPAAPLGQVDEQLEFSTGVKRQPGMRLVVAALVNSRITGPRSVGFGTVQRAKGGERLVSLERRDGLDGIPIAALRYDKSRLQVLPRKVHERRTELILKVLPGAPPGAFSTLLEVVLDDPAQRRVLIPVYGYVEPSLRTTPALLLLPKQAKPGATLGSLSLNAEVLKVEAPAGIEAQQKGRQITLFAKGKLPTADAWLVLHTKTAGEERVRVRLVVRD